MWLSAILALTLVALTASSGNAEPVTWSFYETGFTFCNNGLCQQPSQPRLLTTLMLPKDTSTGTANFSLPFTAPTYTGDDFLLTVFGSLVSLRPLSQETGAQNCVNPLTGPNCQFNVFWNEVDNQLLSVGIFYESRLDELNIGLLGGMIASDDGFGGCQNTQCGITGFWVSNVPEPSTAALLLAGLFGLFLLGAGNRKPRQF